MARNNSSCTTTGMSVNDSEAGHVDQSKPGHALPNNPDNQEGAVERKFTAVPIGREATLSAPSALAVDSGTTAGIGTDSGASVGPITVKPVDAKNVSDQFRSPLGVAPSSYKGDTRAQAQDVTMPEQPSVRQPMKQFQTSKHLPQQPAPFLSSTAPNADSESGN